jgi:four helix bundle protein
MARFEKLEVWQRGVQLSVDIYRQTSGLKDFGFRDQITRAGLSIPSNIAEGLERSSKQDKIRFLEYARGSCAEVRTQAIVGAQVGFISEESLQRWSADTTEIAAMIQGLIRSPTPPQVSEPLDGYEVGSRQ